MNTLERMMQLADTPPRRRNKNRSGRQGRKTYNGRNTLSAVGGHANLVHSIYFDRDPNSGALKDGAPGTLCHVVPRTTGFQQDGQPFRSPNSNNINTGAQRG